jgi:hypothetical protein
MDNWDPAVTNGLARDREVILFNNAGISNSGGETPNKIAEMARHAAAFIAALGLERSTSLAFRSGDWLPSIDSWDNVVLYEPVYPRPEARPASREKGSRLAYKITRYSEFRNIPSCRWRSSPMLAFHRGELGILKRSEKGQECIIGPISSDPGSRWCNPFQCPFLHRKICFDVDVCRLDAFVAKPKSDHGHVDSGL